VRIAVAEAAKTPDPRAFELTRMRIVATALLGAMAALFIATTLTNLDWAIIPYVRAFAEAGMAGACADWFAVVALFRRPLGLPIPHTAVIPNNKQRIGAALGRFISNNFLDTRVASERLAQVDFASALTQWIGDENNAEKAAQWATRLAIQAIEGVPSADLGRFVGEITRRGVAAIPAAPLASKALAVLWAQGEAQELLDQALDFAEAALLRNKDYVLQKVSEQSYRWAPKWIDGMIAGRVMNGLLATVREMHDPNHPWRGELSAAVENLISDLATDPEFYARGEALKAELLENPVFHEQVRALWQEIDGGLYSHSGDRAELTRKVIDAALRALGGWLRDHPALRAKFNRQLRLVILRVLLPRRQEVAGYVTQVVDNWDSATLVNRLELQVGKDLQYIRINGTLVGGLVGLTIFAASKVIAAY
jgi:uncharacterized membrane-anchored protein YjiN (DUF445 family)